MDTSEVDACRVLQPRVALASEPQGARSSFLGSAGGRLIAAGCLVLAVFLPILRETGAHSWETVWAEDGSVYFQQAHDKGALDVVLRGYAGYLQLPPRLLGALAAYVQIDDLAVYFKVAAAVVNPLLAAFVYWASEGWIASRPVRLGLASLVVLSPVLGNENTGTITNTIWTFAAVAPWACIAIAEAPGPILLRSIVVFLAATATPVSAVFLPLALVAAAVRRTRGAWTVATAFMIGLALQFAVVLNTTDLGRPPVVRRGARFAGLVSVRVFAEYLVGDKGVAVLWRDYRVPLLLAAPICICLIAVLLLPSAGRSSQALACTFLAFAFLTFFVPVWGRGTNFMIVSEGDFIGFGAGVFRPVLDGFFLPTIDTHYVSAGLRFSVVPVFMVASAFAVLIGSPRRRASRLTTVLRVLFVTHIVLLTAIGFAVSNGRSAGPTWSGALDRTYRRQCVDRSPTKLVEVATPMRAFPVVLRCDELPH